MEIFRAALDRARDQALYLRRLEAQAAGGIFTGGKVFF
jgi:hypothetical protein